MKKKNDLSARLKTKKSLQPNYYDPSLDVEETPSPRKRKTRPPSTPTFIEEQRERREKKTRKRKFEETYNGGWHEQGEVRKRSTIEDNPLQGEIDLDMLEDPVMEQAQQEAAEELKAQKLKRRLRIKTRVINGFLVFLCIYMIFLIYGCISTDYHYNEKGVIVPQVLSVSDVKKKKNFDKVYLQYKNVTEEYKKILRLDYRLAHCKGVEDPKVIAVEYAAMAKELRSLGNTINGMQVVPEYESISKMLCNLLIDSEKMGYVGHMTMYCTSISDAIQNNNEEAEGVALSYRDSLYQEFTLITANIYQIGVGLNGVDVTPILNFNPDTYADDYANGRIK